MVTMDGGWFYQQQKIMIIWKNENFPSAPFFQSTSYYRHQERKKMTRKEIFERINRMEKLNEWNDWLIGRLNGWLGRRRRRPTMLMTFTITATTKNEDNDQRTATTTTTTKRKLSFYLKISGKNKVEKKYY